MYRETNGLDQYMRSLTPERRIAMEKIRNIIRNTVPGLAEFMIEGVPTFFYHGELCSIQAQKSYIAFNLSNEVVFKNHKKELKKLNLGKSCFRFNSIEKLPIDVLKKMLLETANENFQKQ